MISKCLFDGQLINKGSNDIMSNLDIKPRVINHNAVAIEYAEGIRGAHQALELPVYDTMLQGGADTLVGIPKLSPESVALIIGDLMEGDQSRIKVLNWACLAAYQRSWASSRLDEGLHLPSQMNRFADATGQAHAFALVSGDYDGFEWSSEDPEADVEPKSSDYDKSYLSLISSRRLTDLSTVGSGDSLRSTLVKTVAEGGDISFRGVGVSKAPLAA